MNRVKFTSIAVCTLLSLSTLLSACGGATTSPSKNEEAAGESQKETNTETPTSTETNADETTVSKTETPKVARKRLMEMAIRFNEITDGKDMNKYAGIGDL